jgi:hypothetical protein
MPFGKDIKMTARFPLLIATTSVLVLSACANGQSSGVGTRDSEHESPAPYARVAENGAITNTAVVSPGLEDRLARLETDMVDLKAQVGQVGPLLEKMPALQDKLTQLVAELQKIDARVAEAKMYADQLNEAPPPAPVKTAAPEKFDDGDMKHAPAKGLIAPGISSSEQIPTPANKPDQVKPKQPKGIPLKMEPAAKPEAKPAEKPEVKAAAGAEEKTKPVAVNEPVKVKLVRIGDEPGKTRIVLDVTGKTNFSYDLDNAERIMIIDLDAKEWAAAAGADFAKSPLVSSYTAQAVEGGKCRMILQLRESVKVEAAQTLNPVGDKGDRIMIDLVKA